jgi:quercetin dioxygenase-like cupin family protein
MRKIAYLAVVSLLLGALATHYSAASNHDKPSGSSEDAVDAKPGVKLENLLRAELEGVDEIEVIVSRVTIPPNSSLPKHWHPGEEFAYVLEGSAVLWQEGKEDIVGKKGDVLKVPLKQVHTAITGDEGAVVLVFRVHEQGEPERIPVDDN